MKTWGMCISTRGTDCVGKSTWVNSARIIHSQGTSQLFLKVKIRILANGQELLQSEYVHCLTTPADMEHAKSNMLLCNW